MDNNYTMLDNSKNSFAAVNELVQIINKMYYFQFENGIKIHAKRKCTYKAGLIDTNYLHIVIIKLSGAWEYYRENKTGGFSRIDYSNNPITEREL